MAEAADWLTECRDAHERREQRLESVEIGVVALISIEIGLSFVFGFLGLYEGRQQAAILQQMKMSTADTAAAMKEAKTSLQNLADAQAKSLDRLSQMNDTLRDSLTRTGTMATASRKQLSILEKEQADRTAQLAKKPKLQLFIASVPVVTGPFNALHPPAYPVRDQTDTSVTFDSGILNQGTASATRVQVRVVVLATDVSFSATGNLSRASEPPDNPFKTWLINIDLIRQNVNLPMTLIFSFPKAHAPFEVVINVDADEIETGTPLANFTITPRKPANEK
jgi:hypothetical protein